MIRFIHAADLHFGASRFLPDYLERQVKATRTIYAAARKLKADFVLLCGDIFHRRCISHVEKDAFMRVLAEYDAKNVTTILINGQHDIIDGDYTHLRSIHNLIERGRLRNTHVIENNPGTVVFDPGGDSQAVIIGVPYGGYTSELLATAVRGCFAVAEHTHPEVLQTGDEVPVIVMAHGIFQGSVLDSGYAFNSKGLSLDESLPVTYWALGDIHKRQALTDTCWYAGSPIQHDFGDNPDKGFLFVKIDGDDVDVSPKQVRGVKRLATVTEIDDETAPEDAWLRFEADASTIAQTNLPPDVVRVRPRFDAAPERFEYAASSEEVLAGLHEVLGESGLDPADVEIGVEKAEKYVAELAD